MTESQLRLTHVVDDLRVWGVDSTNTPEAWIVWLDKTLLSEIDRAVHEVKNGVVVLDACGNELLAKSDKWPSLMRARQIVRSRGGFVVLRGLAVERYPGHDIRFAAQILAQTFGRPVQQDSQGTLVYDVSDEGADTAAGARITKTNARSSFHTDASYYADKVDTVFMMCIEAAMTGGESEVVSGYAVHNKLLMSRPTTLPMLYDRYHFERKDGAKVGEPQTRLNPIVEFDGNELTWRYFRLWIERGQEKARVPLTVAARAALDELDSILDNPMLCVRFRLRPGEILVVNNRFVLHNRAPFQDYPNPTRKRHVLRVWLQNAYALSSDP